MVCQRSGRFPQESHSESRAMGHWQPTMEQPTAKFRCRYGQEIVLLSSTEPPARAKGSLASLPRALRRLKPDEVEDVLCIFTSALGRRRVVCVGAGVDDARTNREILPARAYNACG
jgi:hypothetical protein